MGKSSIRRLAETLLIGAAAFLTAPHFASAQAEQVDWKLYGGVADGVCFYDDQGVTRTKSNTAKVWTKCLPQKKLEAVDVQKGYSGQILENSAQRIAKHYLPPISQLRKFNSDDLITITSYEVTANISNIEPSSRIYYEINCAEKLLRELSVNATLKGKIATDDKPSEWHNVPPETNASRLLALICKADR